MNEINMLKVPYFLKASSLTVLQESLQPGKYLAENLDRIAYVFVADTKSLYHVSMDKTISLIGGSGGGGGDLDELTQKVNKNTLDIADLQTQIDEIDTDITSKINAAVTTAKTYTDEQIALNIV